MRLEEDLYLVTFNYCIRTSFCFWFGLVCCFTSQSTAMVMSGWDARLTFFPGKLEQEVNQYFMRIHSLEFNDHSPQKYGTRLGSNSPPLVLQSDMHKWSDTLPTALRGLEQVVCVYLIHACLMGKISWFAS